MELKLSYIQTAYLKITSTLRFPSLRLVPAHHQKGAGPFYIINIAISEVLRPAGVRPEHHYRQPELESHLRAILAQTYNPPYCSLQHLADRHTDPVEGEAERARDEEPTNRKRLHCRDKLRWRNWD